MSILIQELSKRYGSQLALDDVTLEIGSGEVVGLLGPNGAGKSTLMKILTCFLPPTRGTSQVMGFDVLDQPMEVRKHVGYLPENNPLYVDMYVREYLHFTAGVHRIEHAWKAVDRMIGITGLEREQNKRIRELSKGYRQRVGLAQALIHDPDVLILDEPTSGLDPNQLADMRDLIKELGREKTVVLSTHIMQEVEAVCDRAIIIHLGKVVADSHDQGLDALRASQRRIRVEFGEEIDSSELKKLPGAASITAFGKTKFEISPGKDTDLRPELFRFAVEKGWKVLSMDYTGDSLEEVFRKLTR